MSDIQNPILKVAAKAVIVDANDHVLIARESVKDGENTKVGQYGLIGGRLNPGEPFEDGLKREVFEEVSLEIEVLNPLQIGEWHPVIKGTPHQIIAIFMLCRVKAGGVKLSKEHDDYKWVSKDKRKDFDIMEPDCFVVDMIPSK